MILRMKLHMASGVDLTESYIADHLPRTGDTITIEDQTFLVQRVHWVVIQGHLVPEVHCTAQ
jgi:hypothetical protein